MPETAPLPVSCFLHQYAFQWTVWIRETGAENTISALAAGECSDPRLAQQRGEPGSRHRVFLNQTKSMIVRSFSFPPFRKRGERMGHPAL
jgi:hypothetical protein